MPETKRLVEVTFEPVALVKLNPRMVPLEDNRLVKEPVLKFPVPILAVVPFKVAIVPEANDKVVPVTDPP